MQLIQLIVLALIQGITEFLPISSSAHLILVPILTNWQDQGLAIDVAVHLGSLIAVLFYCRRDLTRMLIAAGAAIFNQQQATPDSRLLYYLVIASIPTLVIGLLLHTVIGTHLRDPLVIAAATIFFALLLWYADCKGQRQRTLHTINCYDAIIIGLSQALALIPGTSRSGITMTAALLLGLDRVSAARLSFLMAIPVILAASGYELLQLLKTQATIVLVDFGVAIVLSALSAFVTLHCFIKFIDKISMLPFVIYRLILGSILIFVFI